VCQGVPRDFGNHETTNWLPAYASVQ
jgi:hypothetical protein